MTTNNHSTVWRIHIRPTGQEGDEAKKPDEIASYALDSDEPIIGIGWGAEGCGEECTKNEVIQAVKKQYKKLPSAVRIFIEELQIGDFVWVRRKNKEKHAWQYFLYLITTDWQFKNDEVSNKYDLHHIRGVMLVGGPLDSVAGPIANSFYGRMTLARIGSGHTREAARCFTWSICSTAPNIGTLEQITCFRLKDSCDNFTKTVKQGPLSFFTHNELEDLVALYLQNKHGYLLVPSTHHNSTYGYEYDLVKDNGDKALWARVQIKTKTRLNPDDYKEENVRKWYLFSLYSDIDVSKFENISVISLKELLQFIKEHPHLLTQSIQTWIALYAKLKK